MGEPKGCSRMLLKDWMDLAWMDGISSSSESAANWTPLEPAGCIGESSAYPAAGIGWLPLAIRERSDEIGAADDADDPAVP
jgi:hypothetical protein